MKAIETIIQPVMTEKSHILMAKGIYTFLVDKKATKNDVAKAMVDLFKVDVVSVNITQVSTKQKRIAKTRKFTSVGGSGKKAVVTLKPGQTISVLSPKTEAKEKKVKKGAKEKDVQKVNIEGKEGA